MMTEIALFNMSNPFGFKNNFRNTGSTVLPDYSLTMSQP